MVAAVLVPCAFVQLCTSSRNMQISICRLSTRLVQRLKRIRLISSMRKIVPLTTQSVMSSTEILLKIWRSSGVRRQKRSIGSRNLRRFWIPKTSSSTAGSQMAKPIWLTIALTGMCKKAMVIAYASTKIVSTLESNAPGLIVRLWRNQASLLQ